MVTIELHRHFEGGLRPERVARLAERNGVTEVRTRTGQVVPGVDPQDPDSIRGYYRSIADGFTQSDGFARFVDSFGLPLSVFRTLDDIEQAVCDELIDCAECGSLHTELRSSPFSYVRSTGAPVEEIAEALVRGVDRAWRERGVSGTFILAFSRQKGCGEPSMPEESRQAPLVARIAANLHRPDRPVGLDIAGFPELRYPPQMFEDALRPAREAGVALSVHAGEQSTWPDFEDAPPRLIVEAIERLGAARIGHGTSLACSPAARALVRERGVGIECCPVSNDRMGFVPLEWHPLPLFLDEGLLASLATDDPLMFGVFTVAETLEAIERALVLPPDARTRLARNGIASAFVTETRRAWLYKRLDVEPA